MRTSALQLAAGIAAAALLLAGCGGSDEGTPAADTPAADTPAAERPAGEAGAGSAEAGAPETEPDTVNVRLTEYRIQMPRTLPAGPTVFRVTNAGAAEHNFEVEGEGAPGLGEAFGRNLRPTETRDLEVELEPGRYKVFCPVEDHALQGMLRILQVTEELDSEAGEG